MTLYLFYQMAKEKPGKDPSFKTEKETMREESSYKKKEKI